MRYLIIKTSAFGDVVQTYPVLRYLKSQGEDVEIDWVVEKKIAPLVQSHPDVSRAIVCNAKEWKKNPWSLTSWREFGSFLSELRAEKYDAIFDLQGNTKSGFITAFARGQEKVGFGWNTASERLCNFAYSAHIDPPKGQNIRRDYLYVVQSYFNDASSLPLESITLKLTPDEEVAFLQHKAALQKSSWIICPGSIWKNKQLTTETLSAFLEKCHAAYEPSFIFLAGSSSEREVAEELFAKFSHSTIYDRLSLPVLQHLMNEVDLVVSMDSLPLHLAATTDTKTFSFFGPSLGCKYRPLADRKPDGGEHPRKSHFSFQGTCPYDRRFDKRCPELRSCKTGACLREVDPEHLFSTFSNWWNQELKTGEVDMVFNKLDRVFDL